MIRLGATSFAVYVFEVKHVLNSKHTPHTLPTYPHTKPTIHNVHPYYIYWYVATSSPPPSPPPPPPSYLSHCRSGCEPMDNISGPHCSVTCLCWRTSWHCAIPDCTRGRPCLFPEGGTRNKFVTLLPLSPHATLYF